MALSISVRETTIIALGGRLDTATSEEAEKALAPVLANPPKNVVFDLAGLEFISSAGLRVLLSARKAFADAGTDLVVLNMQPQIARVVEVIKSLPGMKIFATAQEADEYFIALQRRVIEGD
jgi:anti-anti-sigma factor